MSKVQLVSIEVDSKKKYRMSDKISFTLTLNCEEEIEDDIEFEATYFGDAYSEHHDQVIGCTAVGPLQKGKQFFQFETEPIDLTKIPIKTLFGVTTILIVAKYQNKQFMRIGYVVNVSYPGIAPEKFVDSEDTPLVEDIGEEDVDEESDEEGDDESEEEEDLEIMDDDEVDDDSNDSFIDEEENDENPVPVNFEEALASVFQPKSTKAPIPLETPIVADKDEFEYKEMQLKQSMIEMTLHESPIIQVFEIQWDSKTSEGNLVESSENEDNSPPKVKHADSEETSKKAKL